MTQWDSGAGGPPQMQFAWPPLTPMVKRVILVNVGVFVAYVLLGFAGPDRLGVSDLVALSPALWRDWLPFVPVWQLVTYGFLHDPLGLGHLFFNMLTLYFFGGRVEGTVGSRRFLVHYLAAIVLGALAHLAAVPLLGTTAPVIGASGGCLAMIVAAAVMSPNSIVYLLFFPLRLRTLAIAIVVIDLFQLVLALQGFGGGGTAIVVHLAGALYGYLAVRRRWIWWDPVGVVERKQAISREERRQSDAQRMDALLAKIAREGLGSLSGAERDFLKRQSEKGR